MVTGDGLFGVLRKHYSRWLIYLTLIGAVIGNTIEAGVDPGGIAAAAGVVLPIPHTQLVAIATLLVLILQLSASYTTIRNVFRWLALTLFAYVGAALLARPDAGDVGARDVAAQSAVEFRDAGDGRRGDRDDAVGVFVLLESNEEVEEKIAQGTVDRIARAGATAADLKKALYDTAMGMFFGALML
ncbi:MAG: divalent metal cation transporter, partial [Candidatus Binatia bacterium]